MTSRRWAGLAAALLAAAGARAADQVSVQQAVAEGYPTLVLYADVLGADGKPVGGLRADQVSVQGLGPVTTRSVRRMGADDPVASILLVDVSASLGTRRHREMVDAVGQWTSEMGPGDRAALVTFGSAVEVRQDFTGDRALLATAVQDLAPRDAETHFHAAVGKALELGRRRDAGLPLRRAIVVLTDGVNDEQQTGLTADDVAREIDREGVPIFAIDASKGAAARGRCGEALRRFTGLSSGLCEPLGAVPVGETYAAMHAAIRRVFVVEADCSRCPADGQPREAWLEVNLGSAVPRSASRRVVFQPVAAPPAPPWWTPRRKALAALLALALVGVAALAAVALLRRRPPPLPAPRPAPAPSPVPAPEPFAHVRLVVMGGRDSGRAYDARLYDRLVVGGAAGCEVQVVGDPDVADRHCELAPVEGRIYVRAFEPGRPTWRNGAEVRVPQPIETNDTLRVGGTEMRVLISRP